MEEKIRQYVLELLESVEQGSEVLMNEVPIFIKEYLVYSEIFHILSIVFALIGIIAGYKLYIRWYNDFKEASYSEGEKFMVGFVLSGCAGLSSIPVLIYHSYRAILVFVAPRIYLVEQFKNMLGGCN